MDSKKHTIIFVPHARARFIKWRISGRVLTGIAAGLGFFLLLSLVTTWSFFTNNIDRNELARIQEENQQLRDVNRSFEDSIGDLENQLANFEQRTRQLAIVAGLETTAGSPESGIGGAELVPASLSAVGDGDFDVLRARAGDVLTSLDSIQKQFDERERWISSTPVIEPVRGILTSGFGYRRDPVTGRPASHFGVDIATAPGRAVQAPATGIVVRAGRIGSLGEAVYISHGYGVTTRYGHLSEVLVSPGQRVSRGDTIGKVGSTGKATGYHLHYEVRIDGEPVNPIAYMLDRS